MTYYPYPADHNGFQSVLLMTKSLLLGMKCVSKYQYLQVDPLDMKGCICHFVKWKLHPFISKVTKCVVSNQTNMSNFHPLEVVGCGSETQLQVGENLNKT